MIAQSHIQGDAVQGCKLIHPVEVFASMITRPEAEIAYMEDMFDAHVGELQQGMVSPAFVSMPVPGNAKAVKLGGSLNIHTLRVTNNKGKNKLGLLS